MGKNSSWVLLLTMSADHPRLQNLTPIPAAMGAGIVLTKKSSDLEWSFAAFESTRDLGTVSPAYTSFVI